MCEELIVMTEGLDSTQLTWETALHHTEEMVMLTIEITTAFLKGCLG